MVFRAGHSMIAEVNDNDSLWLCPSLCQFKLVLVPMASEMQCTIDAAIPKCKVTDLVTRFTIPVFLVSVDFRPRVKAEMKKMISDTVF